MSDSKPTSMFDLQKIINDVKSMISPASIPAANKNDPIGYRLSELSKHTKDLVENHTKQSDLIARINDSMGALYQAITKSASTTPPTPTVENTDTTVVEDKK